MIVAQVSLRDVRSYTNGSSSSSSGSCSSRGRTARQDEPPRGGARRDAGLSRSGRARTRNSSATAPRRLGPRLGPARRGPGRDGGGVSAREAKRIRLNGAAVSSAGGVAVRVHARLHTRPPRGREKARPPPCLLSTACSCGRCLPRATCRPRTRALGQRNAALRRVAGGLSDAPALEPWTRQLVALAGRSSRRARGCCPPRPGVRGRSGSGCNGRRCVRRRRRSSR